jgi:transcriptional regulator GlxA family with amidase domain
MTYAIRQYFTSNSVESALTDLMKSRLLSALTIATLVVPFTPTSSFADEETKRIGIMLYDGVLTSDVVAPMEVFGVAIANEIIDGYEVVTVATEAGPIKTHEGVSLYADYGVANSPDLDVIIVGSRYDMNPVLEDNAFMDFVTVQARQADWVASNCSGAYILANAGLLDGVEATTYPGGEVWLKLHHPSIDIDINATVVVDDNVVTSNGSLVSYAAAVELLKNIEGPEVAKEVADSIYFTRLLERYDFASIENQP